MAMHPEGFFAAEVIDHGISMSKSGTPQIVVRYKTAHGEITGYFSLSDRAAEYTAEKVAAMGFRGATFEQLNDGRCLLGARCVVAVKHESYNGEVRSKINGVRPEGYEGPEVQRDAAAAKSAKRFDALLTRFTKIQPTSEPRPATPMPKVDVAAGDEIPF